MFPQNPSEECCGLGKAISSSDSESGGSQTGTGPSSAKNHL
jgi:hypothetical protein